MELRPIWPLKRRQKVKSVSSIWMTWVLSSSTFPVAALTTSIFVGAGARGGWGGEAAGVNDAVLCLDEKELLALNMIDFAPVDGDGPRSVVEADSQSIGIETLDFASEAVAIAHNEDVRLFASGKRHGNQ